MNDKVRALRHIIYEIEIALETGQWLPNERTELEKARVELFKMIEEIEKQP